MTTSTLRPASSKEKAPQALQFEQYETAEPAGLVATLRGFAYAIGRLMPLVMLATVVIEACIAYRIWGEVNGVVPQSAPGAWVYGFAGSLIAPFERYETSTLQQAPAFSLSAIVALDVYFVAGCVLIMVTQLARWLGGETEAWTSAPEPARAVAPRAKRSRIRPVAAAVQTLAGSIVVLTGAAGSLIGRLADRARQHNWRRDGTMAMAATAAALAGTRAFGERTASAIGLAAQGVFTWAGETASVVASSSANVTVAPVLQARQSMFWLSGRVSDAPLRHRVGVAGRLFGGPRRLTLSEERPSRHRITRRDFLRLP
jgi:hypothetical protein